jgi:hypothetical protein
MQYFSTMVLDNDTHGVDQQHSHSEGRNLPWTKLINLWRH